MQSDQLSDEEFRHFQSLIAEASGMRLAISKKNLVISRLSKRLRELGIADFQGYIRMISDSSSLVERQTAVDLLTTNETYFFREQAHFDFLRKKLPELAAGSAVLRIWSAACSSGQEAFSTAMILHDYLGDSGWEITGSDVSLQIINQANRATYPLAESQKIPMDYLKRYCLRGVGANEGKLMMARELRDRVNFRHESIITAPVKKPAYDIVFLRNVLIYFDADKKRELVAAVLKSLRKGGLIMVGHSESLNGVSDEVTMIAPSIYRKH